MTTAELITAGLSHVNAGQPAVVSSAARRQRAHFFATKTANRVDNSAPHWWRMGDGSVSLTAGVGTMPSDFAHAGQKMRVFVSGLQQQVLYRPIEVIKTLLANNPQSGVPEFYSLFGRTAAGLPQILCWPSDTSTLLLKSYVKRMPELVDAPLTFLATTTATVGLPNSTSYTYQMTFVTSAGETEGGDVSNTVSAALFKVQLTGLPLWWGRTVTSRRIYRNKTGETVRYLVGTISDNTTTTFLDNVADASLVTAMPTILTSVSGLEYFPEAFHDSAIYDGLIYFLSRKEGDGRDVAFDAKWEYSIRRMWEEYQQGRNSIAAFPAYPGIGANTWSRRSVS